MKFIIVGFTLLSCLIIWIIGGELIPLFSTEVTNQYFTLLNLSIFANFALLSLCIMCGIWYIRPITLLKKEIVRFITSSKERWGLQKIHSLNGDIEYIVRFFQRSLEILQKFKEEYHAGKMLKSEVDFASEIQRHVLGKKPTNPPSLDIIANCISASEVGGDSYDIIQVEENTYIYIGDVTGHGVASGFIMMIVNALISALAKIFVSGAQILAKTNEIVKPRVKSNMLMTLLMVRWDELKKELWMTGAGHENLLVYKRARNKTYAIKSGWIALAMTKSIDKILKDIQIPFEEDDIAILYTDGITEARSNGKLDSPLFWVERLIQVIDNASDKTAEGIYKAITIAVSNHMGYTHRQFDDITLLVIHYRGNKIIPYSGTEIPTQNLAEWNWNETAKTALGKL